tara:strand:+ start:106 stop:621 length:516 start_codon:yes stop_codon:yes gene_type:complete
MILGHTAIILAISILVCALILGVNFNRRLQLFTKIFTSSIAVLTVICLYYSLESIYGWPKQTEFPTGKFYMLDYHVSDDRKRINLWLIKRNKEKSWIDRIINDRQPRNISIYYDENVEEQLQKIKQMADGRPFPVQFATTKGKKKEQNDSNESEKKEKLYYVLPDVVTRTK